MRFSDPVELAYEKKTDKSFGFLKNVLPVEIQVKNSICTSA